MPTHLADDPRLTARVTPALTEVGRRALEERMERLRTDVLDPLRPHLIGPSVMSVMSRSSSVRSRRSSGSKL